MLNKEQFLDHIKHHQITIVKDDGVYRHIICANPKTSAYSFNIVTSPTQLFYYGDMGSYSFSRVYDMFEFFRHPSGELRINPNYWAEKLESIDIHTNYKKFSLQLFKTKLLEYCENDEQKQHLEDLGVDYLEDEFDAISFIRDFDEDNSVGLYLSDFWECNTEEFTYHYLFCCYAITWLIHEYDKAKQDEYLKTLMDADKDTKVILCTDSEQSFLTSLT